MTFELDQLFLDLDGVLADFDRGVETVVGKRPDQLDTKQMWSALAKHEDFFGTLELMHDAQVLWDYCQPYAPIILTGLPLGRWAEPQKRSWVANMLGRDVEVITTMSKHKPRWSRPGRVLVDDRERTRAGWEREGGIFILHVSAAQSIAALQALGLHGQPGGQG